MKKKILVIEDERPILENIQKLLHLEGYEPLGARNGWDGIDLARNHLPDVILCDIMMPKMSGYDVLKELQNDPTTTLIPFIFLTAKSGLEEIREGMGLGADDYIVKPFNNKDLIQSIKTQLEKKTVVDKKFEDLRRNIITTLPHEMKTPITSILVFARLISDINAIPKPEMIVHIGQSITKSCFRLQRFIENYLTYAEIELMSSDPKKISNLLNKKTTHPDMTISMVGKQKAKEFQREKDLSLELLPQTIKISEEYLTKIITELFDNAFKFSARSTPVNAKVSIADDFYQIQITNTGRGMTADQVANVGAYMQFDRKLYEQQGSGLGLVISKRLTELHEGRLIIKSVPDGETIITVMLKSEE